MWLKMECSDQLSPRFKENQHCFVKKLKYFQLKYVLSLHLKGHFDETLGADFFLFFETAFPEIHTSKISTQNIE